MTQRILCTRVYFSYCLLYMGILGKIIDYTNIVSATILRKDDAVIQTSSKLARNASSTNHFDITVIA